MKNVSDHSTLMRPKGINTDQLTFMRIRNNALSELSAAWLGPDIGGLHEAPAKINEHCLLIPLSSTSCHSLSLQHVQSGYQIDTLHHWRMRLRDPRNMDSTKPNYTPPAQILATPRSRHTPQNARNSRFPIRLLSRIPSPSTTSPAPDPGRLKRRNRSCCCWLWWWWWWTAPPPPADASDADDDSARGLPTPSPRGERGEPIWSSISPRLNELARRVIDPPPDIRGLCNRGW
ncbi:Os09g0442850 [Oryza sativa Japonica Group]|uniref:Os09g0442850 protein n=1 Tax=Oryza sativa subsp. japonica TaxID=39947 RepID=A0A0P0XMB1_ORYSJ|nr:hypothetical protein EE612_048141 [Oryza sativa]BAT08315.1 Os09g0442850 [Oryza sativa Japonica Group]